MTDNLQKMIEEIYQVFSVYNLSNSIESCPCCVSDEHKKNLMEKPLRNLEEENLSRFAFKAVTTWGNISDYKHFFPRILELMISPKNEIDEYIVFSKLNYLEWRSWQDSEQKIIFEVLLQWWKEMTQNDAYKLISPDSLFFELGEFLGDYKILLDNWFYKENLYSIQCLVDFIMINYVSLRHNNSIFKIISKDAKEICSWMEAQEQFLEAYYLENMEIESELLNDISDLLFIMECEKKVMVE
ncbi:hypothetical protein [Aureivirga sp. CE67]|uniref:hypothetical protein n=1 Tax=Aureivirga sp. CE67 TaxID=1788983 RepID=UPI0018CA1BCE|nr:hypothetical protein [Aureivirga sp. CE67]